MSSAPATSLDKQRDAATARKNAKRTAIGRTRITAPRGFWQQIDGPGVLGVGAKSPSPVIDRGARVVGGKVERDQWKITVHRNDHGDVDVTDKVTALSWTDPKDSAVSTGSVTWVDPKGEKQQKIVRSGDMLICQHATKKGAQFVEVFRMRLREPTATETTGERTFNLANDLLNLQQSIDDFKFTKEKGKKPLGWRVDEVVKFVCDKYGIPAVIPTCSARITNRTWLATDGLTVINDAYRVERLKKGRRFVLTFRKGTLVVTPLRRSKALIAMASGLIEAVLEESFQDDFATQVTLRANPTQDKGKDKNGRKTVQGFKITVDLSSPAATKRWGVVHRIVYVHGQVSSQAEAVQLGMRHLAKIAKAQREITLTHPGIPSLKKGDAIYVNLTDLNKRVLVWVAEVTHTLSPSDYSMDVTCVFDDPFANVKPDRVDENEAFNTKKVGRTSGKKAAVLGKQPLTNKNRSAGDRLSARAGNVR